MNNDKQHDATMVALVLAMRDRCAAMAEGYVYGNAAGRAIRTMGVDELLRNLEVPAVKPAQLVRRGLEGTPAMLRAEHTRAMDLVRRSSAHIRELHSDMGRMGTQLADAQGVLQPTREALELAATTIGAQQADIAALREELARAEAALAMSEDQAAMHGTTAANAGSLQVAA